MNALKSSSQTVDLKLWIFKFVRDEKECMVCVEGYRKKDYEESELTNWRSTAVKKRISSQTLVTVTGTKYVLHGVIDQDSAIAFGYPKQLIERFKDGFPYEWKELLQDYYNAIVKSGILSTSQWFNKTLLGGRQPNTSRRSRAERQRSSVYGSVLGELVEIPDTNESANRGVETRRKKQSVLRDKISEEEDVSSEKLQTANLGESVSWGEEDRNDENLPPANSLETLNNNIIENTISVAGKIAGSSPSYDSKDNCKEKKNDSCCTVMRVSKNESGDRCFKMPALPVQKRRTRRAGAMKMYGWIIRFSPRQVGKSTLFTNFGFVLEGFCPEKCMDWKTSCIMSVENSRLLRSATSDYELLGPINTIAAAQQDFGCIEFDSPDSHVDHFYADSLKQLDMSNERKPGEEDGSNGSDSSVLSVDDEPQVMDNGRWRVGDNNARKSWRYSTSRSDNRRTAKDELDNPALFPRKELAKRRRRITAHRIDDAAVAFQRTRSGRLVKLPMSSWTKPQRNYAVRGVHDKVIGINTDSVLSASVSDMAETEAKSGLMLYETEVEDSRRLPAKVENVRTKKRRNNPDARLVCYSTSPTSEDNSDNDNDAFEMMQFPATPFYGRWDKHTSRVIDSSPEVHKPRQKKRLHKRRRLNNAKRIKVSERRNVQERPNGCEARRSNSGVATSFEPESKTTEPEVEPIVSFSDVDSEAGTANMEATVPTQGPISIGDAQNKAKKWTNKEIIRLKLAVRAIRPESEEDWVRVAHCMRNRDADECRDKAVQVLKLRSVKRTEPDDSVRKEFIDATSNSKIGSLAFQTQAERFTRRCLTAADRSDFFEGTMNAGSNAPNFVGVPSIVSFDSDDSLLSVLNTPKSKAARINKKRSQFMPYLPNSSSQSPRSSIDSYTPFKHNSVDSDWQQRYVHQMKKTRGRYVNRNPISSNCSSRNAKDYKMNIPQYFGNVNNTNELSDDDDEYFL